MSNWKRALSLGIAAGAAASITTLCGWGTVPSALFAGSAVYLIGMLLE